MKVFIVDYNVGISEGGVEHGDDGFASITNWSVIKMWVKMMLLQQIEVNN